MNLKECEILIQSLEAEKAKAENMDPSYYAEIDAQILRIQEETYKNLEAWDRVYLARHSERPKAQDYIALLFPDFMELHGDRGVRDDKALIGGLATFEGQAVTVLAQAKGKNTEENLERNFGMCSPEGYRKALRLAKQAEKFKRPIINLVDTSGAFPGKEAEERGQAEAIAKCLEVFSTLEVPIISIVIGEGGSGGALALSVADRLAMLENAVYSILSPEGFASILWKDASLAKEAAKQMKLTSYDLLGKKVIDAIIKEPLGGAQKDVKEVANSMHIYIRDELKQLQKLKTKDLIEKRYEKYRRMGSEAYEES